MEQYNNRPDPSQENRNPNFHALVPGIILVGIGAIFLLDNLHILHAGSVWNFWPVILIAVGLVHILDGDYHGRRTAGIVLTSVGAVFLAVNLGYLTVDIGDLWPLILIGAGILMLVNRLGWGGSGGWGGGRIWSGGHDDWGWGRFQGRFSDSSSDVHEAAVFSGSRRIVNSQDFRRGHASAVFGGINLDLTGARIEGKEADLRLSAVYGGIVVRIPLNWNAEVRGGGVFGGFVDRSVHPPANAPDTKRLIIRGGAVFGGITIKN